MKILVTGAAGFLGGHFSLKLLELGHEVVGLDNFYTGTKDKIQILQRNKSFTFIERDICDEFSIDVDYIANFACPASPIHYQRYPVQTIRTNVLGMLNMLELARKNNAPILQASTSEIYGDPLVSPQTEEYWGNVNTIGFRSCYDEGKRVAETMCSDYSKQYNCSIKIARIFNTYGPGMQKDDGRVVSNLIVQALGDLPLTIYGDGSHTRSFCYVDDLIDGLMKLLFSPADVTGPINLGNPEEYTILQLAKKIKELTGSPSEIQYQALPSDDPKQRKPDISKAIRILEWNPVTDLDSGMRKTIKHFQSKE
jgi:UDP-glucuronate decarboxylase